MTVNFYEILEVYPTASQLVISAAYKTLSNKHHPDKNNGDKNSEELMALINVAYDVLSDPIKRKQHDDDLEICKKASVGQAAGPQIVRSDKEQTRGFDNNFKYILSSSLWFVIVICAILSLLYVISPSGGDFESAPSGLAKELDAEEYSLRMKWEEAERYLTGSGSVQNFQTAKALYESLSEIKSSLDPYGLFSKQRLAEMYFFGLGEKKDYQKALNLYKQIGRSETNFMVGVIYYHGLGVRKDWVKAYHYYNLAQSVEFELGFEKYTPNPLIQKQQEMYMLSSKEDIERARFSGKSGFASVAKVKKDLLEKKLSVDEVNKAQNLKPVK